MKYNKVSIIRNHNKKIYLLDIDDKLFWYDWDCQDLPYESTILFEANNNVDEYELNIILPLNINDPKETLDKFFKLLLLQ